MHVLGIIELVGDSTTWGSGFTIAPKVNDGIRMRVDLLCLNKGVKQQAYLLPRVSDTLSYFAKEHFFSKFDVNSGFWLADLYPGTRSLTTFITLLSRFAFKIMPFGISLTPEFFSERDGKTTRGDRECGLHDG